MFLAIAKKFGIDDEIGSLLQYFPLPKRQFLILGRGIGSLLEMLLTFMPYLPFQGFWEYTFLP